MLSIITPVKNAADHLDDCLRSIEGLRASGIVCEHIIIDGGSTDGTVDIIASAKDVRWSVHPGEGALASMLRGVEMARCERILFLMGDDVLSEQMVDLVTDPSLTGGGAPDLVLAAIEHVDEKLQPLAGAGQAPSGLPPRRYWTVFNRYPGLNGALLRRTLLDGLTIPSVLGRTNDRLIMLHLLARARSAVLSTTPIVKMRHHDGSATHAPKRDVARLKAEMVALARFLLHRLPSGPAREACAAYLMKAEMSLVYERFVRGGRADVPQITEVRAENKLSFGFVREAILGGIGLVRGADRFAGPDATLLNETSERWRNRYKLV